MLLLGPKKIHKVLPVMSLGLCQSLAPWSLGAHEPIQLVVCDYEEWPSWFIGKQ